MISNNWGTSALPSPRSKNVRRMPLQSATVDMPLVNWILLILHLTLLFSELAIL